MKAAVPAYLGTNFQSAAPGHRFSLYFSYWGESDWRAEDKKKGEALRKTLKLPQGQETQIEALAERQSSLIQAMPEANRLMTVGRLVSPLATGMGIEHPLENGFAFLNPYGLPYLPGSSIKGVLRKAAQELIEMQENGWSNEWENALFGLEPVDSDDKPKRGALTFWDSIPELAGNALEIDIMTPHYSEYYQGKASPHDSGQPTPIPFMVIPAKSKFTFHISCTQKHLLPELRANEWKDPMRQALEHAFDWLGFGAKTSVGYGAMEVDEQKLIALQEQEEKLRIEAERMAAEEKRLACMSPTELEINQVVNDSTIQKDDYLVVLDELKAGHWQEEKKKEVAIWVREQMQRRKKWVETSKKKNPIKDKNHMRTLEVLKIME